MSSQNFPERSLDPPESRRRKAYKCALCDARILEGDDYYDIPDLGICCEDCIEDFKRYGADPDEDEADNFDRDYDRMCDEELRDEASLG